MPRRRPDTGAYGRKVRQGLTGRQIINQLPPRRQVQAIRWDQVLEKPDTYPPSPHEHTESEITDLDRVRWKGPFAKGQTYEKNDQVRNGPWLAIAKQTTTDTPGVIPTGNENFITDQIGGLSFSTLTEDSAIWITGNRYTWPDGGYVNAVRYYLPDNSGDFTYEGWMVIDPEGSRQLTQVFAPIVPVNVGWLEFGLSERLWLPGVVVDVILVGRATAQGNSYGATWQVENKNGNPDAGKAWFQNSGTQIRINTEDEGGTDQSAWMDIVEVGATMTMAGQQWTVVDVDDRGGHVRYGVQPDQGRPGEDSRLIQFEWGSVEPVPYVRDDDFFQSYPNVTGFQSSEYNSGIPFNNNAYGVDLFIREVSTSTAWEIQAYTAEFIGTAGGELIIKT